MSMGGGGGAPSTTTQKQDWPSWIQPYFQRFADESLNQAIPGTRMVLMPGGDPKDPNSYRFVEGNVGEYGGPTRQVLGFDPLEQEAMGAAAEFGRSAVPTGYQDALNLLQGTAQGKYLSHPSFMVNDPHYESAMAGMEKTAGGAYLDPATDPYLQKSLDMALRGITDSYNTGVAPVAGSNAALKGTFGGSSQLNQEALDRFGLGRNLSEASTSLLEADRQRERALQEAAIQNMGSLSASQQQAKAQLDQAYYTGELQRMLSATQQMPGLLHDQDQARLLRFSTLQQLGVDTRNLNQAQVDQLYQELMTRYNFPKEQLAWLGQELQVATPGATVTTTAQPATPGTAAQVAGYAGTGASLLGLLNQYTSAPAAAGAVA
jgi:hypothetical protein